MDSLLLIQQKIEPRRSSDRLIDIITYILSAIFERSAVYVFVSDYIDKSVVGTSSPQPKVYAKEQACLLY